MTGDQTDNQSSTFLGLSEKTRKDFDYVMGIDFGTTFSGISYARVGEFDDQSKPQVFDISRWPGGSIYLQTPTKLLYLNGVCSKWGNFRQPSDNSFETVSLFKLHLDETRKISIPKLPEGLSIEKVISDYLKAIFDHAYSEMIRRQGNSLDRNKLRFCLTVPATWTENSKNIMRKSVIRAGIISENDPQDRLLLGSEPEAITMYCETFNDEFNLKPGQNFLICNAGKSTVDVAVYRKCIDENDKSSLMEEVACDGDMVGSETLDTRFRKFVYYRVKTLSRLQEDLSSKELDAIVKIFAEDIKMQVFHPSSPDYDSDYFALKLPERFKSLEMDRNMHLTYIDDSNLFIHPELMISEIFDPVFDHVTFLIDRQLKKIERKLDAIFLAGEFGQSDYLLQKIRDSFSHEVEFICAPNGGEMALVRGAVLMGLNPQFVKQRVIRRTYGYECALEFDERLDPESKKSISKDGDAYCNKRFQSYALKGEVRDVDYYAYRSFKCYYNKDPVLQLYAYDGDPENFPRYTTDLSVRKVTDFVINLPHLPNKGLGDIVLINAKLYLNQTEVKLEVEIENNIKVYRGSYREVEVDDRPFLGDITETIGNLDIRHSYKGLKKSY